MATLPVAEAREDVAVLFLSYLGRAPEFQAMNYYVGLYNQLLAAEGTNAAAEENAFKALSAQIYVDAGNVGEIPSGPSVSDAEYVDWIYQNVLGRAADEGGRAYWISQLENGSIDRADLVGIVVASAAEDDRDGAYLANRTEVALEFAKFENSNPQILASLQFNAKQVLEGVNETEESVAAAEAKLVSATNGGQSFTLTVGVDNLVGTSGNDVFNVVPVNPTNSEGATTLGAFDTIDGGAGRDTLNIFVDGEGKFNTMQVGTIRNIEIINIRNSETGDLFGTADDEVNVAGFQGAEQVWQFTRANDVINLSATAVAGFADIAAENGQDFDVRTAAGVAVANVAFDNVSTEEDTSERDLTIAGAALTGAVITGSLVDADAEDGDDAFLNLTLANTGTNGDVTFTLNTEIDVVIDDLVAVGGAKAKVVGLDASASTGDVEFEFSSADIKTLKGGAGNDSFTFNRALTSSDSVDGGEGTDVVVLAAQGKNLVTQDYNAINALQNIEIVAFQTSNITVDASKLSFDLIGFDLAANGTATVANLAADQTLLVTTQGAAAAAGTLVLNTAAVDANVQLDDEDLTLTLTVNARATGVTGGTLTLEGEGEVTYDNTDAKFATIDVSELNGDFTLTEMAASVVENVVLGADVSAFITLDVAPVGEDDAAVTPSSTFEAMDVITGFKAFADAEDDAAFDLVLGLGNVQTVEIAASVGTLNAAFEQAATAYTGDAADSDVVLFQFEGNTYLYADNNDDGKYGNGDFAIKFVGLYDAADFNVA